MIKNIIIEEYINIINLYRNNILENFYYLNDVDYNQPITDLIFKKIVNNLPGLKVKTLPNIIASGAEEIVLSLDDYRIVKLFFDIRNASKLIPFLNKNLSFTSNIYSLGTIQLDRKVKYYKKGSKYSNQKYGTETDKIYYVVMERIVPDNKIYSNLELKYNKISILSNIKDINTFIDYINFIKKENSLTLEKQIKNNIIKPFITENNIQNISVDDIYNNSFILNMNKKDLNDIYSTFLKWKKNKPKTYLYVYGDNLSPLLFKNLLWVYLGKYNLDYNINYLINLYYNSLDNNDKNDFNELFNLLKNIIIDNNIIWYDIHSDQFGRSGKENKLVAIDIGIKNNDTNYKQEFDKNIINISLANK